MQNTIICPVQRFLPVIFLLQTSSSGLEKKPIVAIMLNMYRVLGRLNWSVIDKAFFWKKPCTEQLTA